VLPPQQPIVALGPPSERVSLLHQSNSKIVAWDTGCFGNRKSSPPLTVKGLAKYVARFAKVIKVDEFRTIITCLCNARTNEYKVQNVWDCDDIKRHKYDHRLEGKRWKKRKKWCCSKNDDGDLIFLHPFHQCQDRVRKDAFTIIRHRVFPNCCAKYDNGVLINHWLPWNYTLDAAITRRHDHQAVWHKDVLAAMNMRRIVQCYARTGQKSVWNRRS
jgi:hypothetical protein